MLGILNVLFNYGRDHEHETIFAGNFRHSSGYVCLFGNVQITHVIIIQAHLK
jgi:hypothetical protein